MAILLLADHDNAHLSDQTAKALTAASKIGSDVHVLVAGAGARRRLSRRPSLPAFPRCWLPRMQALPTIWPSRWRR